MLMERTSVALVNVEHVHKGRIDSTGTFADADMLVRQTVSITPKTP